MTLDDAKMQFIEAWGRFGSNWGINRTMAQVHALLLISSEALSAEDIMESLAISRGNANMNLRALIDLGLIHKSLKPGQRREYFIAEKNMVQVVRQIVQHRKKKELEPMLRFLEDVKHIDEQEPNKKDKANFLQTVEDIQLFAQKADKLLEILITAEAEWIMSSFIKLV